jgi:predicted GNAT family acetyltransferase
MQELGQFLSNKGILPQRIDPSTGGVIVSENFQEGSQVFNERVLGHVDKMLEEYLPTKDDGAFYSDLGSGIGSGLFFMAGSLLGGGLLGVSGKGLSGIASLIGAGTESQSLYEEAVRSGGSDSDILISYLSGGGLGATEGVLGIGKLLSQVGKRAGKNIIKRILIGAVEEGFQETVQTLGRNLVASETFDLSRDLMDGVGRSGAVALITGLLFSGGTVAVERLLSDPNISDNDRVLLEQARNNFNEVSRQFQNGMVTEEAPVDISDYSQSASSIVKTHNQEGGSSYTSQGKVVEGYAVGTQEGTGKVVEGKEITEQDIKDFARENEQELKDPNKFIGTWYNKADGNTHLDISTVVKTEEEAHNLGRANKQLAIFDIKNEKEIDVIPQDEANIREKQSNIPAEHSVPVYHFSDATSRGMVSDVNRFGENNYTRGDQKKSPMKRTFFYTDPKQVTGDQATIQGKNLFIGNVDARKVYDLSKNAQKYGFEDGAFSIDRSLEEAKNDGWEGVRYPLLGGEVVNMFEPVYMERPDAVPSLSEIIGGRWDKSVSESKKRLNTGMYGAQLFDLTTIPAVGVRFVSDIGIIMADKLIKTKTPFGTPLEFTQRLIQEFGEEFPIVRRFAREIYEYARSIRDAMKKAPLNYEQIQNVRDDVHKSLLSGNTEEYIPTGKGAIILGGDIADFEGGRRKHLGSDFGKDQALKALRKEKSFSIQVTPKAEGKVTNISLKSGKGSITAVERDFDNSIQIKGSGVAEDIKGKGVGAQLYDAMIDYAIANGYKTIESDASLSQDSYNQYLRLKDQGFEIIQSDKVTIERIGKKTYYRRKGDKGVFTVKLPAQPRRRRGKSYPIWATHKGVAKQISNNATTFGNDTVIFMVYPQAWGAVKANWVFQKELNNKILNELGEAPDLPSLEKWKADTEARNAYVEEIMEAIKEIQSGKSQEEQRLWNQDKLAYEFGIENGINLKGKIKGVAKFLQVNHGEDRIDPHKLYEAEIEGYNYQELDEPIDFNFVKEETKDGEVAVQGKIKEMTGEKRERSRRNNIYRQLQQRGLTVTEGQSELIDALIQMSEGDQTGINAWLQQNPDSKGEIVDVEQHNEWVQKNKVTSERLRDSANKSLEEFLKPADTQRTDTGLTLMGGIPFFNPEFWKSLGVMGKAISRGAKGFTKWAQAMVKEFGEWIKPALRALYAYVNQLPNVFKPVSKKELDYELTKDNKPNPVVESQKNEQKQHPKGTLPSKTKGYNMNREHPKLAGILQPAIAGMRKEFDKRRRGTISNEELLETARRNAESLTDADVWDIKKGDVRNAEDILAMRLYITDKMLKVADELKKLTKDNTVLEIKDMSDQLVEVMRMWQVVRGVGTELGRGVQSFNIPMSEDLLDSFMSAIKAINGIDPDNKMGGGIIQEMMEDMAKLKTDTPEKRQSVLEWVRYVFLNWILQNPLTDIANIHGNLTNLSFHIFANIGNLGGAKTLATGIRKGFREGRQSAMKVLHGEQEAISKFTEGSGIEVPSAKQRSWKNYFKLLVPTTRLGLEDAFFRSMAKNIETERMVKKTSRELGVSPDEIFTSVETILTDPELAKFERKEYREMVKYLEQIEDQLVFQQELGTIGKGFSKISRVAFPIIPFVTTPTNILKAGYGASPFGLTKLLKKDLGKEERNQIIRKALAGSALLSGMGTLISQGLMEITGGGSEDAFERDLMAKMGYKPNHIYINTPFGKYGGSYMNINPMNTVMSIMGDMFDKYRFNKFSKDTEADLQWYNKVAQDLSTGLLAMGRSVTEQSYLRGVREMMDAFSGRNPDWFMRMLTGYARVGAIQGIQRITGIEDRGRYVTRGRADEQIQKNFPLASNEGLIESISAFGEQRQSQYERFPFPFTKIEDKNAYKWMEQEGLTLTIPSRGTKIGNRKMNRKEYEMFSRSVGTIMDETIQKLWQQQTDPELPEDKKLSLEELQDKIDGVYNKAKDAVKKQIKEAIFKQLNEGLK